MIKKRTPPQRDLQLPCIIDDASSMMHASNPKIAIQSTYKRGHFQESVPLKNLKTLSSQPFLIGQSNYMHSLSAPIGYSCHAYFYPTSKGKMCVIPLPNAGARGCVASLRLHSKLCTANTFGGARVAWGSCKKTTNALAPVYALLKQRGMTCVTRSAPAAARVVSCAQEEPKNPNTNKGASYKQSQIQALPRKLLFANLLMKGGDKNHAYRVLLDSIGVCKLKMFEKERALSALTSKTSKDAVQPKMVPSHQADYWSLTAATQKKEKEKRKNSCLQSRKICHQAIHKVEPVVETRKVRVRGNAYQVPSIWHIRRRERIAVRWMAMSAYTKRESGKRILATCLGQELFDSLNMQGASIQKRDHMYKLAANSRVNARYRWW